MLWAKQHEMLFAVILSLRAGTAVTLGDGSLSDEYMRISYSRGRLGKAPTEASPLTLIIDGMNGALHMCHSEQGAGG